MKKKLLIAIISAVVVAGSTVGVLVFTKHEHNYIQTVTAPTCTAQGYTTYTCECGESYTDSYVDATGHDWQSATCGTPKICLTCNETDGTALGHTEVIDQAVAPDCVNTGLTQGSHCLVCNEVLVAQTVVPAFGHVYEDSNQCSVCEYISTECFTFTLLNDDTYRIEAKDVNNIPANIIIPSSYEGKPVTSIGDYAFDNCYNLTSVVIGDSVTSIGWWAFWSCSNLKEVNYLGTIDQWAEIEFANYVANPLCYAKQLKINGEVVTEVNLTSATKVSNYAFYHCDSLTSVEIPDSVTSIGDDAFSGCRSLTSVEIPDSVTSIGSGAFACCDSLTSVVIGDSVTSIGSGAFYGCSGLTSIEIPDSVTSIGNYAFEDCDGLTSVVIPGSVTSIGNYAFRDCDNLTSVVIGDSVTYIGEGAFRDCDNLSEVYYKGDAEGWKNITIGSSNSYLKNATRYYYSESQPTSSGNYWHYDENGVIVEW